VKLSKGTALHLQAVMCSAGQDLTNRMTAGLLSDALVQLRDNALWHCRFDADSFCGDACMLLSRIRLISKGSTGQ
jgi:hypothetical protein